ncbi:hypothetical protein B0J13DRAFT_183711 [Dactylonectria estremocensis]|uniref:UBX domain-containing protein 2 n=1 Tax=Dactylonectria estremocensis TaxID=1079267 RepID=A0A9P9FC82_9HYPO|nr:hypothetical protein B0J13DRAFT_183711 [Dactylonectria estremocensis]
MFYQGTLQDGISTAVDQQKLVLCFVTDESDESTQWENEFLLDESLGKLINEQSIALRLLAGSEEAGYLAQIFPLPRTPTVVVIKNGELKEYITPGTTKEDFFRRVQNAFSATTSSAQPVSASTSSPQPEPAPVVAPPQGVSSSGESSTSENVRRILAERAAKLKTQKEEAERKAKELAKEERTKAQAKGKADAEAGSNSDNAVAHKAAEAVKKRRQEQQEERRRILKRIEDDKAERRLRTQAREQQRADDLKGGDVASSLVNAPETKLPSTTRTSEVTALQVRMFDGSTLRSRFKTTSPLKEVRSWVDENRTDGAQPFTFKQVLTPAPNKAIDETEESKSVGELGLSPSSTLVLIPVKNFTTAYDNSSQNIVSRFFAFLLSIFSWFFALFSSSDGRAPAAAGQEEVSRGSNRGPQSQSDRQRDQQLYNGNSLNFESRPDEEKDD